MYRSILGNLWKPSPSSPFPLSAKWRDGGVSKSMNQGLLRGESIAKAVSPAPILKVLPCLSLVFSMVFPWKTSWLHCAPL